MRLVIFLVTSLAMVAGVHCRDAAPAQLRLEGVSERVDARGVHIAFTLVNDGGRDAYAFTTSHGFDYDDERRTLTVFVRQQPYTPNGSTGDFHFFLQPYVRLRAHERREVQIDLPRVSDGVDLRPDAAVRWIHEPLYKAEEVRVEVGWGERPFEDAFKDSATVNGHEEMARRVLALQAGVLTAGTP
jgi:hypothetical protein